MADLDLVRVREVLLEVEQERRRQFARFGDQSGLPDGTGVRDLAGFFAEQYRESCKRAARDGTLTFEHVLREEVFEAFAEADPVALRAELIQVAAVAVQWIEAVDRRGGR